MRDCVKMAKTCPEGLSWHCTSDSPLLLLLLLLIVCAPEIVVERVCEGAGTKSSEGRQQKVDGAPRAILRLILFKIGVN
jgi:hypothetical protein